jgi:hypothetical protein
MTISEETGDYSSLFSGYPSVDPKIFDNKLTIEEPHLKVESDIYASIDVSLKHLRREKLLKKLDRSHVREEPLYEDIQEDPLSASESKIYEKVGENIIDEVLVKLKYQIIFFQVDLPLRQTQKSRSLVWKNWSRIYIFDSKKKLQETNEDSLKVPALDIYNKRDKTSLSLSDISKHFSYRSVRKKAKQLCNVTQSAVDLNKISTKNKKL